MTEKIRNFLLPLIVGAAILSSCSDKSAEDNFGEVNLTKDSSAADNSGQEIWNCDYGDPRGPFSVVLKTGTYEFRPYSLDGGALRGDLRIVREDGWNGAIMTELELVGSGAPAGRWGFVEEPGKRKALFIYAVESSGDGSECTLSGYGLQYTLSGT